jgi:branched-subunit amino acid aminotransferase/4-amino-4-deoxychorismate lyase
MKDFVCFNGEILPSEEVKISPINRGMMYGDGCFETFRSYAGKFLDFEAHFNRLKESLSYLQIEFLISQNEFENHTKEVLKVNNLENSDSMIRIQCWRKGVRGYKTNSTECEWIITSRKLGTDSVHPSRLVTSETLVIPNKAINRSLKLSNGLNYIVAAQDATFQDVDDALMLTLDGFVSETTVSNIFWGEGDKIFTPSESCDLLPGITRSLVLKILSNNGFSLTEGQFYLADLKSAEYAFTTNSLSEIRFVAKLDHQEFDITHPELNHIHSLFQAYKTEQLA